jgi:hypothetical protein
MEQLDSLLKKYENWRLCLSDIAIMRIRDADDPTQTCGFCKNRHDVLWKQSCWDCLSTEHLDGFEWDDTLTISREEYRIRMNPEYWE